MRDLISREGPERGQKRPVPPVPERFWPRFLPARLYRIYYRMNSVYTQKTPWIKLEQEFGSSSTPLGGETLIKIILMYSERRRT